MIDNKLGTASDQSLICKIATAVVILFICGAIFVIQKAVRQTGGTAETYVQPVQEEILNRKELPPPEEPEPAPPQPLPDSHPKPEVPMPRIASQPVLPRILTPAPAAGMRTLPAPLTEVHPLSDAEEVMGAASSEVGEIGVTRTFKLPDDSGQNELLPPPND